MAQSIYGLDEKKTYDLSKVTEEEYISIKKMVFRIIERFYKSPPEVQLRVLDNARQYYNDEQWIIFYNTLTMPNDILCKSYIDSGEYAKVSKKYNTSIVQTNFKRIEYKLFPIEQYIKQGKLTKECLSYDFEYNLKEKTEKLNEHFKEILEILEKWQKEDQIIISSQMKK